ncbi:MAG: glycoside hydrolase family 78 protein [Abitibacteriaceae bacterium]|nr:glycoside hydrolase family 78 protein [Abditibacteriaceae bacterium]
MRCEYAINPLGIDELHPRLSWMLASPQRGEQQTAYQVMVATTLERLNSRHPDLWDSGKVASGESVHVVYGGKPLQSRQPCYWKVRVWNRAGLVSQWSLPASWEMGLLKPQDWQAQWIGAGATEDNDSLTTEPSPYFRKTFTLNQQVKSARAYICGLGFYELYLNGHKVGGHVLDPNQTNYDTRNLRHLLYPVADETAKRVAYVTYDVTAYLKPGQNVIGVVLGNGWYNQRDRRVEGWMWYGTPRFILRLETTLQDGSRTNVSSDESWKVATGPIVHNGIFTGEIYDARLEQAGWNTSDYNDATWTLAHRVRPPVGTLRAQMAPPDKVMQTLKPIGLTNPKPDIYRFDLGQNLAGWARLRIQGPRATKITLRFIEEGGQDYGQADTYILKGEGVETYEPRFTWHGFRYVEVSGAPGPLTLDNLVGRVVHSAVEPAGKFECSNPLLNHILQNYQWTQLSNLHGGVPSDCPHRERLGYTGDGQITAPAAIYNFDMARFYTKWINDIGDAQNSKTGFVPHTAPFEGGGGGPAWGSAYVLMPWYVYLYYGDRKVLQDHYAGMKAWVQYLSTRTNQAGIVDKEEPGGWCLGDWCTPDKLELPPTLVNTSYYAHVAQVMADAAQVLGKSDDQTYFSALAAQIAANINRQFLDKTQGQYSIGRQGADAFPLAFGLVPVIDKENVFRHLLNNTLNNAHFDTGILATPLLLDALTQNGQANTAYALLNQTTFPSYGDAINKGATTLWENWNGAASHNHPMFGSVCRWFYSDVAGINPDPQQPGFKHILIRPQIVGDLTYARAEYRSLYGTIKSGWAKANGLLKLSVDIPANCTATVFLPGKAANEVKESGLPISQAQAVKFLRSENGQVAYAVGSGHYEFTVPNA